MIINKLDLVIENLEQIKANQYILYQEMKNINDGVRSLENRTTKLLSEINGNVKTLADNTSIIADSSIITAYNSSVSAFYAEKSSQLLNSLGYLIAFK